MKKITFVTVLLLCQYAFSQLPDVRNFVVTANPNQSYGFQDRFDYEFDIRGNYGFNEIKLWVYLGTKTSKPSQNTDLVSYVRWNREGDDNLNFPSYFTKAMWSYWWSSAISRSDLIGESFTLLVQYGGNDRFLYYTIPEPDADNDGVPDSQDQCPNEVGPLSNNGCPVQQGPPEFEIEQVIIKGKDDNKNKKTLFDSKDRLSYPSVIKFYREEEIEFKVKVKNIGGSRGRVTAIHGYNNNPNAFDPDPFWGDCEFRRLDDGTNLDPGDTATFDYTYFIPAFYNGAFCPEVVSSGYFWFFPDERYINAEVVSFVMNNRPKFGIEPPIGPFALRANLNDVGLSPLEAYNIEVFDLSGQKVLSKTVTSPYEENSEVYQLNSGIYIIKSEKGTRKVYVN